jgi:NAD+ synthase (glutamine-hydrolysing)
VSKNSYLRSLIAQQSSRCLAGYVYSSCGFGESTQDLVFGGNALIYENGRLLSESDRFALHEQIRVSEIDVERLRHERIVNKSFAQSTRETGVAAPRLIAAQRFQQPFTLTRPVDPHPFVPAGPELDARCNEILNIQTLGLAKRVVHTHSRTLVIGISGGLDSTLALLVAAITMDKLQRPRTDIVGITMPGFGTTDRTYNNALRLMRELGVQTREIPIAPAVTQHFKDIQHDSSVHDITYENAQARERTQILFDVANQMGGLLVGTGDLSELALGWATYNGDHMSSYGVNASVPKTLVKHLVQWVAAQPQYAAIRATLLDIVDTPVSPELLPADTAGNILQKTEDLVGPYELHDFFLYHAVRCGFGPQKIFDLAVHAFSQPAASDAAGATDFPVGHYTPDVIKHWLSTFFRRFFNQQFKRSCLPDGPKVGSISLSPRGDWRMPSDANAEAWLQACADIEIEKPQKA